LSESLAFYVGDRDPSVSDQLTIAGTGVDLSAKTVTFKMRPVGSSTLKVNAPVSFKDATGQWRYDWAVADLNAPGSYLAWIETTTGGKVQTVQEFMLSVLEHGISTAYVDIEEFKQTASLIGENYADPTIRRALIVASRAVDAKCGGRRFYPDPDANQVRYYTPTIPGELWITDLLQLTSLKTAAGGANLYPNTWVENTDFLLEPFDGPPWNLIRPLAGGSFYLSTSYPRSVQVTGKFGWLTPPEGVKWATELIAAQLVKRIREAPFGIVADFAGEATRISRGDPQIDLALAPYKLGHTVLA